jgi:hypothetical protein
MGSSVWFSVCRRVSREKEKLTHNENSRVFPDSLGETFRSLLLDDVPPSGLTGSARVESLRFILGVDESRNRDFLVKSGFSLLTLDRRAVDDEVSEVTEKLLSTVLGSDEVEEFGSVVDESGPGVSSNESRVGENSEEERNVGLDSTNTEFYESSEHLATSDFEGCSASRAFDEKGVVVRLSEQSERSMSAFKCRKERK